MKPFWIITGTRKDGTLGTGSNSRYDTYLMAEVAAVAATRANDCEFAILEQIAHSVPPPPPPISVVIRRAPSGTPLPAPGPVWVPPRSQVPPWPGPGFFAS